MIGEIPSRALPVIVVAMVMSVGAMKLVTLPDRANRPKASVARSGVVWRKTMVRLAACNGPPAAPIKPPQI